MAAPATLPPFGDPTAVTIDRSTKRRRYQRTTRPSSPLAIALAVLGAAMLAACGTPVGVTRVDPDTAQRMLTASILSTDELSTPTRNVLYRRGIYEAYVHDPAGTIASVHRALETGAASRDDICALAELSFQHAQRTRDRAYYLASAVYAYAFLFPGPNHMTPDGLDPRLRLAADLYNRGLAEGLKGADGFVQPRAGTYGLPFGTLTVGFDAEQLRWGRRRLDHFFPVADLAVTGMKTRYRWPGLGAPLVAGTEPLVGQEYGDFVEPWAKVPVTMLLTIPDARSQVESSRIEATLRLNAVPEPTTVAIDGRDVPLEIESTASLAYTLSEAPVWQQEIRGFLQKVGVKDSKANLAALEPYIAGRIPVVLVHGTASSSGRWAEMLNELENDPRIHSRYQFWLFTYDTGNPIAYSAMLFRQALTDALQRLDPEGRDPALRRIILVGHSQGGLLSKMAVIDSGDVLWDTISKQPLTKLTLTRSSSELLHRMMFVQPLPFVRRVIFIATPQHGSYLAGGWLANEVARFVTLPTSLVHLTTDLVTANKDALVLASSGQLPTSIDSMNPTRPFIRALASIPISPDVAAHSIIAVEKEGPPDRENDGVVAYASAHIDGVESEYVVHSGHSCQGNPSTIEEVRRILLVHAAAN
jgi:pimeloyl-ACP methyl ester carboxylesterase